MKILYLNFDHGIAVLGDKGASVHVREFVRAAADQGHEVLVVCSRLGDGNTPPPATLVELAEDGSADELEAIGRELGVDPNVPDGKARARELARLAYDRGVDQRVLRVLQMRGFRPDFIYERHALFASAGARIAAHLGCPRILEVNAPLVEEHKRFRGLHLESTARRLEAASFEAATAVVAVSEAVKAYVQALAPGCAERVQVLANGVDLARFAAAGTQREQTRAQLGIAAQTAVIGFIGSFKAWHGTDLLFDVFRDIAKTHDVHLLAVGDGPCRAGLSQKVAAAACGRSVTLTGRVPHAAVPALTAAIDVVVAPYAAVEDFYFSPLKVIEALASARAVVAPRIGQLRELIEHGKTGLLYRPGDAQDCRRALTVLLEDPALRAAMGHAARASVAGRGWERLVQRVIALAQVAGVGVAA